MGWICQLRTSRSASLYVIGDSHTTLRSTRSTACSVSMPFEPVMRVAASEEDSDAVEDSVEDEDVSDAVDDPSEDEEDSDAEEVQT